MVRVNYADVYNVIENPSADQLGQFLNLQERSVSKSVNYKILQP